MNASRLSVRVSALLALFGTQASAVNLPQEGAWRESVPLEIQFAPLGPWLQEISGGLPLEVDPRLAEFPLSGWAPGPVPRHELFARVSELVDATWVPQEGGRWRLVPSPNQVERLASANRAHQTRATTLLQDFEQLLRDLDANPEVLLARREAMTREANRLRQERPEGWDEPYTRLLAALDGPWGMAVADPALLRFLQIWRTSAPSQWARDLRQGQPLRGASTQWEQTRSFSDLLAPSPIGGLAAGWSVEAFPATGTLRIQLDLWNGREGRSKSWDLVFGEPTVEEPIVPHVDPERSGAIWNEARRSSTDDETAKLPTGYADAHLLGWLARGTLTPFLAEGTRWRAEPRRPMPSSLEDLKKAWSEHEQFQARGWTARRSNGWALWRHASTPEMLNDARFLRDLRSAEAPGPLDVFAVAQWAANAPSDWRTPERWQRWYSPLTPERWMDRALLMDALAASQGLTREGLATGRAPGMPTPESNPIFLLYLLRSLNAGSTRGEGWFAPMIADGAARSAPQWPSLSLYLERFVRSALVAENDAVRVQGGVNDQVEQALPGESAGRTRRSELFRYEIQLYVGLDFDRSTSMTVPIDWPTAPLPPAPDPNAPLPPKEKQEWHGPGFLATIR